MGMEENKKEEKVEQNKNVNEILKKAKEKGKITYGDGEYSAELYSKDGEIVGIEIIL